MNLIGLEILACVIKHIYPCFPAFYGCIWIQPEGVNDSKAENVHIEVEAECNKCYCSFFSFP